MAAKFAVTNRSVEISDLRGTGGQRVLSVSPWPLGLNWDLTLLRVQGVPGVMLQVNSIALNTERKMVSN